MATAEREATMTHPVGSEEHRISVEKLITAQLKIRNRPGGYWIASVDPAAAQEAETGESMRGGQPFYPTVPPG